MKNINIFQDAIEDQLDPTKELEGQLTGGCYAVPAAAISLLMLVFTIFYSFKPP